MADALGQTLDTSCTAWKHDKLDFFLEIDLGLDD